MTLVKKHNAAAKNQLVLKQTALPLEMAWLCSLSSDSSYGRLG